MVKKCACWLRSGSRCAEVMSKSLQTGLIRSKKSAIPGSSVPKREKSLQPSPEVVLSTRETSYRISREVAAGRLKKIAPRLYTSRVKEAPDKVIRRNLWDVIGLLFPDAVITQ